MLLPRRYFSDFILILNSFLCLILVFIVYKIHNESHNNHVLLHMKGCSCYPESKKLTVGSECLGYKYLQ